MKQVRGFAVVEFLVLVLWVVGSHYVARDYYLCPEVNQVAHQQASGEWVCKESK